MKKQKRQPIKNLSLIPFSVLKQNEISQMHLSSPILLQCLPILYCNAPVIHSRCATVLLTATHHMKPASPQLRRRCIPTSHVKNLSYYAIDKTRNSVANLRTVHISCTVSIRIEKNTIQLFFEPRFWQRRKASPCLCFGVQ